VNARIRKIYAESVKQKLDGLILFSSANISYLTGYTSRDSYLLISRNKNIYITDSRYKQEARNKLGKVAAVLLIRDSAFKTIAGACIELGLKRIGFEEKYLSCCGYKSLSRHLSKGMELVPTSGLVEESRQIKTDEELKKIKKALQITTEALEFAKDFISVGRKEVELAGELERFIRYHGANTSAFDIIVASGPNSSYPHHKTSQRKFKDNEPVLIDMGVEYMGYKSDLTRVFFLGKMNTVLKKIYQTVKFAHDRAIKAIAPGVQISKIDAAARQYIADKGYGGFFGHNLGHGIGLEVHEKPHISSKETSKLKPGMVFTVEPGIYLPGKFGIRIEDVVLTTNKGCEVISGFLDK
jgi:Xaa-Pro aminopeptidase